MALSLEECVCKDSCFGSCVTLRKLSSAAAAAFGLLPSSLEDQKYRSGRSGVCHMTRTMHNSKSGSFSDYEILAWPSNGLSQAYLNVKRNAALIYLIWFHEKIEDKGQHLYTFIFHTSAREGMDLFDFQKQKTKNPFTVLKRFLKCPIFKRNFIPVKRRRKVEITFGERFRPGLAARRNGPRGHVRPSSIVGLAACLAGRLKESGWRSRGQSR